MRSHSIATSGPSFEPSSFKRSLCDKFANLISTSGNSKIKAGSQLSTFKTWPKCFPVFWKKSRKVAGKVKSGAKSNSKPSIAVFLYGSPIKWQSYLNFANLEAAVSPAIEAPLIKTTFLSFNLGLSQISGTQIRQKKRAVYQATKKRCSRLAKEEEVCANVKEPSPNQECIY